MAKPVKFDKYILLKRIAAGGMAEVFRAKLIGEEGFEKLVVIKRMLPHLTAEEEMVNYFIDEARLAALLKHENIIHIYDFGNFENSFFIAMEYLFGKDLFTLCQEAQKKKMPIALQNILTIVSKICEGLDYAHNLKDLKGNPLNIIHRDVSPHNIFLTYEGQVKIIDFGIAKAASHSTLTRVGVIKGKAAYMSPEQAEGKSIDHRSDIYAVGIILYELLTGKRLYEGDTFEVLSKVRESKFEPLSAIVTDLPQSIYRLVDRALAKYPDDRYASCEEMRADIENCIYELNFRPTHKKLAEYLNQLFAESYAKEQAELAESVSYCAEDQAGHFERTEAIESGFKKTEVIEDAKKETRALKFTQVKNRVIGLCHQLIYSMLNSAQSLRNKNFKAIIGVTAVLTVITVLAVFVVFHRQNMPKQDESLADLSTRGAAPSEKIVSSESIKKNSTSPPLIENDPKQGNQRQQAQLKTDATPPQTVSSQEIIKDEEKPELADESKIIYEKGDSEKKTDGENKSDVENLLDTAESRLKSNKLKTPEKDSAYYYYVEALKIDPENDRAKEGMKKIASAYANLAEREMDRLNQEKAMRYINTGLTIDPENKKLLALKKDAADGGSLLIRKFKSIF